MERRRSRCGRLGVSLSGCERSIAEFLESDDHVIALGHYSGRAAQTGKRFSARFAHVWTLRNGFIVRLQQCADTVQIARALTP